MQRIIFDSSLVITKDKVDNFKRQTDVSLKKKKKETQFTCCNNNRKMIQSDIDRNIISHPPDKIDAPIDKYALRT